MGKARLYRNCDERGHPFPPSGRRRAWASAARARAGLGFLLLAAASASGLVLAQTSGCARCGAAGSSPIAAEPPPPYFSFRRTARLEIPRREFRTESPRREAGGGSYEVCVRACDGGFFPVTYFGARSRADSLQEVCQSQCPNAKVELYSFPFGGTIDEAVSSTGEPYSQAPNAHKFEQSYESTCSCRRGGQSWAEALASAEAKYGHSAHDILVTPEKSAEMSRPIGGLKKLVAEAASVKSDATTIVDDSSPAPLELDVNGVDKKLSAAAASISRTTSGIKDENGEIHPFYRLNQGRTVEEKGPDGSPRRVRIVGPAF